MRRPPGLTPHEAFCWYMPEGPPSKGCWDWRGPTDKDGYGQFGCYGTYRAARMSYEIYVGPVPDGTEMLHSCDRSICVQPLHLRPGTHAENMREAMERNRLPPQAGVANGHAKLTEDQVRWIRDAARIGSGFTASDFATAFGVTESCIHRIWTRRSWRHLD